jgi:succinate dehydrogenase / fumarate reductase iron-sulfur subunit
MVNKTVQLEIRRQASPDAPAVWEKFELEWRPGMNVISAMMEIAANPVTADVPRLRSPTIRIAWRRSAGLAR